MIRTRPAPVELRLPTPARLRVSPEMFWKICRLNPDLRLERTSQGRMIVMGPATMALGGQNAKLTMRLGIWTEANGTGKAFDSSTGYTLPNGAVRAPDASWISQARLVLLPIAERNRFALICPDFVVELRSRSDRLNTLQRKMHEYREQGARLGWLLDPLSGRVEVYRPDQNVEVFDRPVSLSGEGVLPGFVLDLRGILFD